MATTGNANKPEQSPSPQNEAITRPLGPPKQIDRVPKPPKPPPAPSTFKFPHDAPSPSRGLAFGGEEAPPSVAEQPIAHIPTHKRLPTSDAGKNTINGDLSVASTGKDSKPQGKSSNPSTPAVQARNALIFIGMVLVVTIISVALFQFRFTNVCEIQSFNKFCVDTKCSFLTSIGARHAIFNIALCGIHGVSCCSRFFLVGSAFLYP